MLCSSKSLRFFSFEFTRENSEKVKEIIKKYPIEKVESAILPLLHLVQRQIGWVSEEAMVKVSEITRTPPSRIYEVATFYTMFDLQPIGKHKVEVCRGLPCMLRGCDDVYSAFQAEIGPKREKDITLREVECLGACSNAPVAITNCR